MEPLKKISALILAAVMLASLLAGCGLIQEHTEMKVISVVAKGDETAYWRSVLAGAEDAAIENGYVITFRGTENMGQESMVEQQRLLQLALDNESLGIVVASVGEGMVDQLMVAKERHIPVIQFDSGLWPSDLATLKQKKSSPVVASVYTMNQDAARMSAEHLYNYVWRDIAADPGQYLVGVIQHDLSPSGYERTDSFRDRFLELTEMNPETRGKCIVKAQIRSSSARLNYAKALNHLYDMGVDAVFMTSGDVVEQVAEEILKTDRKFEDIIFTGFDAGDRQLNWLRSDQKPVLIGSVTQDAYQIGYKAVTQCINALEARGVTAFVEIPGIWYDRSNLEELMEKGYLEEG